MSKKNNKGTKRKAHDFDLQREKAEAEKRAAKLAKQQNAGVKKVKKSKGVRIRKGVVLKGIKVVDAESKQKVRKELAKAARVKARSRMDVDDGAAAAAAGSGRAGAKKRSARVVVPKAKAGKAGAGSSKAAAGDEMQE
ncbi:hypothetical protein CHLRE_06g306100v5 [Chlamydomonas reinhardtii]|uniref:Uncharacterized protein n=1 Tax=Chlamydomonas reinhardtii TaxID=3055 RepID=A0A2K3DRB9_CHLRE|nr:uncharacterized protein CHLRE_06g306100v5 [Chlamydomonas reinhardtii]XP_042924417.1 uncharacterized protein CHLRE_06g306100v5 [Chlamydomonas reinhardtii]PNW83089.1 hypothetical protein CHLRE_06g306100v5 [Chlamydomonas reinhardtii]PNW83090.1 hypothetical protein CHLRE_06g306100v5 [Chlamydomonas reinhardtii]